jgi:hypothetical protein
VTPNSIARWPSAGRDLTCGHVFGIVRNRHGSGGFIELLNEIDAYYPKPWNMRLILNNHSAHLSKQTQAWLAKYPHCFVLVLDTLFSKMTRSFLRALRAASKQELLSRIHQWIGETNAEPVVPRWTYQAESNASQVQLYSNKYAKFGNALLVWINVAFRT